MKRIIIVLIICLGVFKTRAQTTATSKDSTVLIISADLNIDQTKASNIYDVLYQCNQKMRELRNNAALKPGEKTKQFQATIRLRNSRLEVLKITADQITRLKDLYKSGKVRW